MKLSVFYSAAVSMVSVLVDCHSYGRSVKYQEAKRNINDQNWINTEGACIRNNKYRRIPDQSLDYCRSICETEADSKGCKSITYNIAKRACMFHSVGKENYAYAEDCGDEFIFTEMVSEPSGCDPACQNGGVCNDANKCDCQPGWMGDACDIACGRVNRETLIIGHETEMHEYPWQVGLLLDDSSTIYCGGILISARFVLTAAHCTDGKGSGKIKVTLGSHLQNEAENAEKTSKVKAIIDHPNYHNLRIFVEYDFSLLELEIPLNLEVVGPQIAPVCLPSVTSTSQYDDVKAVVTGWGRTSIDDGLSNILLEATVMTMDNAKCNEAYDEHGPYRNFFNGIITDSMICALEVGEGPCHGDSGGPLVTDVGGFYNLIGVVSWSHGQCHSPVIPVVYSRVTSAIDWITSTISKPACNQ